jgi:hypothetical protein
MMRKTGFFALAVILAYAALSGALAQSPEPSLPANLKIKPPAAGVSPRLAQLSGIWEGSWNYDAPPGGGGFRTFPFDVIGRELKIAIVKITPPSVKAIYARPGKSFPVREASVAGDTIILRWGHPGEMKTLTLSPTGNPKVAKATLDIEGKLRGGSLTAKLLKK